MSRILSGWLAAFVFLAVFLVGSRAEAAPTFPALSGRVVDQANVLPPEREAELTSKLQSLENKTSRQVVVVTVASLQGLEIEEYGYQLGRAWGIGQKNLDNGALLVVAPNERRVRIEVGYGLEGILTDALSNVILQEQVLPRFRNGDLAGGVMAGADALIEQLSLPDDEAKARVATAAKAATINEVQLPAMILGFVAIWLLFGVIGMIAGRPGRRMDAWFWPLFLLTRGGFSGHRSGFRGGGGSFGGGGASGRW